jgi:hypothetical protein
MDIRGRCYVSSKQIISCPAKYDTILWVFENDYTCYREMETCTSKQQKEKVVYRFARRYLPKHQADKVVELYLKEKEEEEGIYV